MYLTILRQYYFLCCKLERLISHTENGAQKRLILVLFVISTYGFFFFRFSYNHFQIICDVQFTTPFIISDYIVKIETQFSFVVFFIDVFKGKIVVMFCYFSLFD